jgi:hypothetical protein
VVHFSWRRDIRRIMCTSVTVRSTGSSAGPCAVVRRARARRAPCKNAEEENSVAEVYLQLGADTVATRAVLHLLEQARRLGVDCPSPCIRRLWHRVLEHPLAGPSATLPGLP